MILVLVSAVYEIMELSTVLLQMLILIIYECNIRQLLLLLFILLVQWMPESIKHRSNIPVTIPVKLLIYPKTSLKIHIH